MYLPAGHGLHHADLARAVGVRPLDDISTFNCETHSRSFVVDGSHVVLTLPLTLQLDHGDTLTIRSTSDFFRPVNKHGPGCSCERPGGQFASSGRCKTCSNRVTALVKCLDGKLRSLDEAGYITGAATAQSEVLLALAMICRGEAEDGSSEISGVPPFFAPVRPSGANVTTSVSEAQGGFPASHAHAGARGVAAYVCGFDAPGGGCCGMVMTVSWSDAAPLQLIVKTAAGTHTHLAGLCAARPTERCDAGCIAWGCSPLSLPAGAPWSLHMAVLHTQAENFLRGFDAGAAQRPQALAYAAAKLASPLAVLHRNFGAFGTPRQWETEKARARERTLIRQGVPPLPPPPDGPVSSLGRVAYQLVRLAALARGL